MMDNKKLYSEAKKISDNAYAPFSKFYVGAALLGKSGKVYTGVNVENSSYGATICAERSAFLKAITDGERSFEKIAVATREGAAWPCGICRQFMWEFCDKDFQVITGENVDQLIVKTLGHLFPEGFRLTT